MYFVYILYSTSSGKYYTGQCSDLTKRLIDHNTGQNKSTKKGAPWELILSLEYATRSDAVRLELQIKKRGASRFLGDKGITG